VGGRLDINFKKTVFMYELNKRENKKNLIFLYLFWQFLNTLIQIITAADKHYSQFKRKGNF